MKINRFFENTYRLFSALAYGGLFWWLPDVPYLKLMYRSQMGKKLNLADPKTFNEKLNWLKLYDRKPEYTMMVDKYRVRKYIAETIGEEYLIPLLGVWEDPEDIDFSALPDQFVLKCNHNSGKGMCICRDKSKLDLEKVKAELKKGLQEHYFSHGREWAYKNVKPCIIAEKYMEDATAGELQDYKIHCFNAEPKVILVCAERFKETGLTEDFYTLQWEHMDIRRPGIPNSQRGCPKPEALEQMVSFAKRLSCGIPFARVDFYEVNGKVYFGEITLYPACGMKSFEPKEWDDIFGSWIELPLSE